MAKPRYFPALTGIRGYAAFWVFLFHALDGLDIPGISKGYLGVDLFFILSGFIISHVHYSDFDGGDKREAFRKFMALRFSRIYPIHIAVLAILGAVVLAFPRLTDGFAPAAFSGFNFVCNVFLVQTWVIPVVPSDMRGPGWSWNGPAWSLSAEWLLYLLFPFLIQGLKKIEGHHHMLLAGACLLAINGLFSFYEITLAGLPGAMTEFAAGCTIYLALHRIEHRFARWNLCAALGLAALVPAILVPGLELLAPAACFVLIAGIAYGTGPITQLLATRFSVLLGEVSLSLYLIHWPLLQIWQHLLHSGSDPADHLDAAYVGYLAGICLLAFLVHRWFEVPTRTWCRKALLRVVAQAPGTKLAAEPLRPDAEAA